MFTNNNINLNFSKFILLFFDIYLFGYNIIFIFKKRNI